MSASNGFNGTDVFVRFQNRAPVRHCGGAIAPTQTAHCRRRSDDASGSPDRVGGRETRCEHRFVVRDRIPDAGRCASTGALGTHRDVNAIAEMEVKSRADRCEMGAGGEESGRANGVSVRSVVNSISGRPRCNERGNRRRDPFGNRVITPVHVDVAACALLFNVGQLTTGRQFSVATHDAPAGQCLKTKESYEAHLPVPLGKIVQFVSRHSRMVRRPALHDLNDITSEIERAAPHTLDGCVLFACIGVPEWPRLGSRSKALEPVVIPFLA
jgi:hypothetical protein